MNPITIAVAELKPALAGLNKVVAKRTTLPVLGCVRIERTREGRIELTGTDLDHSATVQLDTADQGEPSVILVPLEDLANVAKGCGRLDAIILAPVSKNKVAIRFPVAGQIIEHRCESLPAAEFPLLPTLPGESAILGGDARTAIHEALACASTDESRQILNGAYLDASKPDAHYVVGTDGRHLYGANSFKFPLPQPLIIPSHSFLGWKGFNEDGDWRLRFKAGTKDCGPIIELDTDHWRYVCLGYEGNFPNWRQVVPDGKANATIEIQDEEVTGVVQTIQRLPEYDPAHHTIGIEVGDGHAHLLGKSERDQPWTRIEMSGAKVKGGNVTILLNRHLVTKALRFGLTRMELFDSIGPMRFVHGGRQMVVMSIRPDAAPTPGAPAANPPPSSTAANINPSPQPAETPKEEQPMPEKSEPTGGAKRAADTNAAEAKPALDTALAQLEVVRGDFRNAIAGLNKLGDLLKQVQRENKASDKEIQSVRQTLRSLQSVRI
jgi:DNA polymerase III sliding clamp (beta) subunit (PCNA family)